MTKHAEHFIVCTKIADMFKKLGFDTEVEKSMQQELKEKLTLSDKRKVPRPKLDVIAKKENRVLDIEASKIRIFKNMKRRKSVISIIYPNIEVLPCLFGEDLLDECKEILVYTKTGEIKWFSLADKEVETQVVDKEEKGNVRRENI
jgi:hypothetical protein